MSYVNRLFTLTYDRRAPVSNDVFSEAAGDLPLEERISLIREGRTVAEVRYAGKLLEQYVRRKATRAKVDDPSLDQSGNASALIGLLREARTPYEFNRAALALQAEVASRSEVLRRKVPSPDVGVAETTHPDLKRVTVLVLDDDPDDRLLLTTTLERSGARVVAAATVDEAMSLVAERAPDVIISDIELPKTSGYDLMKRLQKRADQIPVLAISGKPQDAANLRDAGFRLFFAKEPGVWADIAATIARMPDVTADVRIPIRSEPKPASRNRVD